ncbi:MAG: META domain-containing protein [Gammaproteobacteria bacterium]
MTLLLVLLTGCGSTGPAVTSAGGDELVGTRWLAEDIDGKGVIDMLQTTLAFETNTSARAQGGCNNAFGNVAFKGDQIEFGAFGVTMKICSEAISDQETRFFNALAETRRYRLDSYRDLLFLMDKNGSEILRFSRMAPLESEPVED